MIRAQVPLYLFFGCMAAGAALTNTVLFRQEIRDETRFTRELPKSLGRWHMVEEAAPTESEYRGLETRDIVKRTYSDGSHMVELVVAYIAHSSRKSAHAQEACLRGSGALVGDIFKKRLSATPVSATAISIDQGIRKSWVLYWYKFGDVHTSDYLKSSFTMFLDGLKGGPDRGTSLVRLLSPARRGEKPDVVQARLEDFARQLVPELDNRLP